MYLYQIITADYDDDNCNDDIESVRDVKNGESREIQTQKLYKEMVTDSIEIIQFLEKTQDADFAIVRNICCEEAEKLIGSINLEANKIFLNLYIGILNGRFNNFETSDDIGFCS